MFDFEVSYFVDRGDTAIPDGYCSNGEGIIFRAVKIVSLFILVVCCCLIQDYLYVCVTFTFDGAEPNSNDSF